MEFFKKIIKSKLGQEPNHIAWWRTRPQSDGLLCFESGNKHGISIALGKKFLTSMIDHFRRFVQLLNEHKVKYIVLGGQAVNYWGYVR